MTDQPGKVRDDSDQAADDFLASVLRYFDGDLNDAEVAELNQLLRGDPTSRRWFVEYCTRSCLIRETFDPERQALLRREHDTEPSATGGHTGIAGALRVFGPLQRATGDRRQSWRILAALCVLVGVAAVLLLWQWGGREREVLTIASLEDVVGDVRVVTAKGQSHRIESSAAIKSGDTIRTRGTESSAVLAYADGTRLTLVGNTSVMCGDHRSKSIVVHQGTLAASVKPQPAEKPLVLTTPSAQVQVLGTRFQIEALENRTDLSVTEGRVRLVRIRDQESVEVPDGKYATVTERNTLLVKDIPGLPSTWEETFEAGLPEGWARGKWVTDELPAGSKGAVKAAWGEVDSEGANYSVGSSEQWLQGLFAVQKNSHIHFTFKTEKQGWINIFIVTRTSGSDDARFSGNYLLRDFPKTGSGQWETVSIPLDKFKRIHRGMESLREVVPFKLLFVFDAPDRGLVIDRVWVTPDGPGRVVSEVIH
jgi:ferric-dicitrate binding protein FerR (iron transport regulator)